MSLINDALKKAQRERTEGGMAATGSTPGSGRAAAPAGKSIALIAGGALALVLVSVGATVYLLNRPAAAPAPQVASVKPAVPAPASSELITKPVAATPEAAKPIATETPPPAVATRPAVPEPRPGTTPATGAVTSTSTKSTSPATQIASTPPLSATPAPVVADPVKRTEPAVAPAPVAATPLPAPSDDRIHQFLDNLRVAGVRAAGNDSRVMMNDKVYRLNEIVDRNLSLRLIKVEANNLTFSDINGTTYVKFF